MPFDTDNRALFVNTDLLAEFGFDPPRTIAELDEIADALTIKEGTRYLRLGIIPWLGQGFLYTWAGAFGATFQDTNSGRITFDHPAAIEALEWMASFAERYDIEHIQDFDTATDGGNLNPFAAGLVAMIISGPWEVASLRLAVPDLNWVAVSVPTPDGSIARTMAGGWSMIVPLGAKNVQGGFDLAHYFTAGEGAARYGDDATKFMTNIAVNDSLRWIQEDIDTFRVFVDGFPHSFNRPVVPIGQMLWDEQMAAQTNALFGIDTPENLLRDMNERVNAELQRIGFVD
jgi:multiple sugar transport system substrate-binding protein